MGYNISLIDEHFTILHDKEQEALPAIRALKDREQELGHGGNLSVRYYAWMNDSDWGESDDLAHILSEWLYQVERDPATGNIISIQFVGEKIGQEKLLFMAIAPVVEPGSFITMQGEDGMTWRWYFDGNTCHEQRGHLVFEED